MVIGIEVKYLSGLSSDDEIGYHLEETPDNFSVDDENAKSRNQLARESRMVSQWGKGKDKLLLFLADQQCCQPVYEDVKGRGIIENDVVFGYFTWQAVLKALKRLGGLSDFEQIIVDDLIVLLQRKDFEPFESFKSCLVSVSLESICPFDENKLYGNVTYEESILILSRFIYKQRNNQINHCSPADHWRFYWPLRKSDILFEFDSSQDVYHGSINPTTDPIKFSRDYWDVQKIVSTKMPLVSITGDNAKEKIFKTFERLSMTVVK